MQTHGVHVVLIDDEHRRVAEGLEKCAAMLSNAVRDNSADFVFTTTIPYVTGFLQGMAEGLRLKLPKND